MHWLELKINPPVVAIIAILLMLIIDYIFPFKWLLISFEPVRFIVAFGLLGIGSLFALLGIGLFLKSNTTVHPDLKHDTNQLIMSGVYRFSRNPMYLGMLLNLIAAALWFDNWLAMLVCIGFVFYITEFQIKPEERYLQDKFGKEYQSYCLKVRRWL